MKKILLLGSVIFALSGCQSEAPSDDISNETEEQTSAIPDDDKEDVVANYSQDWEQFKQAVSTRDKSAVLFFAVKHDQSLRDVLELSYDYIFDDQMIENIAEMNYEDLPQSAENIKWKKLSTYYYGEVDGENHESGTFLFFEERPEGLRIVNFLAAE